MDPTFLTLEDVVLIHEDQIERYGGGKGVRDRNLLESALAMPSAEMRGEYFHRGFHEMAAAYLFHIVQNHPFIDGNKRAGAMAAFVFLKLNGLTLQAPEAAFERLVLAIARGEAGKPEATRCFRKYAKRGPA